uniref:G-protein coupled receptors family 3 profile domain-containing protein n=1 Tax=Lotharella globosa TaxID=91324 RepID=A0A7S3Z1Z2_9EUKA
MITCPPGYFRLPRASVRKQCENTNFTCPMGKQCLCQPCSKALEVEVHNHPEDKRCRKVEVCKKAAQNEPATFRIRDNLERNLSLTYTYYVTEKDYITATLPPIKGTRGLYEFTLTTHIKGSHMVEITFEGGILIDTSPFLVEVQSVSCGPDMAASEYGECIATVEYVHLPNWFTHLCIWLTIIGVTLAFSLMMWTFTKRRTKLIVAAQPIFLYIICLGCAISFSSIVLSAFDDRNYEVGFLDQMCVVHLWLYGVGFVLSISALSEKTLRVKRLMVDNNGGRSSDISVCPSLCKIAVWVLVEILFLSVWTITSPPRFTRHCVHENIGGDAEFCRSVGRCNDGADRSALLIVFLSAHIAMLCHTLYACYLARHIPQEFAEHKWITAGAVGIIQILILTPLMMKLAWDDPLTTSALLSFAIFLSSLLILITLFLPKIQMIHCQTHTAQSTAREDVLFNLRREVRGLGTNTHSTNEIGTVCFLGV